MSALGNFSTEEMDLFNPTSELELDYSLPEDYVMVGSDPLLELDADELEQLLNSENWPVERLEDSQETEVKENFQVQENAVAGSFKQETESILLITVPEPLQEAPIFNKFPTVPIDNNVFEKMQSSTDGFDGACLRLGKQVSKRSLSPTRRTPLQVIQYVVNQPSPKESSPNEVTKPTKRKQKFDLTREDGVSFDDGIASEICPEPKMKRSRRYTKDQAFVWAETSDEETERAPESIDENQRCPGCKKIFKKLASHKCKKLQQQTVEVESQSTLVSSIIVTVEEKPQTEVKPAAEEKHQAEFVCLGCKHEFKSKRALTIHIKKCCHRAFTLEDSLSTEEPVKEVNEPGTKRQTRSSCHK